MEDSGLNTGHNFTKQTHSFGETDGLQNTHTHGNTQWEGNKAEGHIF